MIINVWYFARVKETLNREHEQVVLPDGVVTIGDLIDTLSERGEAWRKALREEQMLVAVNHTVASRQTTIADNDEIAFFPPVTGG